MVSKEVKDSDKHGAIISHDLFNSSPSAQNIFNNEVSNGARCFDTKGMPFGPSGKGTSHLYNVAEASGSGMNIVLMYAL